MTVRAGREFLAVPGPTNIPDEVLQAMHRPAVEIYSEPLIALTDSLLAISASCSAPRAALHLHRQRPWRVGSGADQCVVARRQDPGAGKRPFAHRLGRCRGTARRRGRSPRGRLAARRAAADVEARLRADKGGAIKAILAVQIDTASASSTTSRRSARPSRPPGTMRSSWSMPSLRSAACRLTWTPGASTSRCRDRRKA